MLPQLKQEVALNADALTAGATGTSSAIDTIGFDYVTVDVFGTTVATNATPTVLKLQQSDTTDATNYSDLLPFVGGTAVDSTHGFVIPVSPTAGAYGVKFNVDLRGKKRYLQAVVSPAASQTVSVVANLGRGEQSPVTAAKANVLALVEG